MWVDQDGVFNTVALPRAQDVLTAGALDDLRALSRREVLRAEHRLATLEDEFLSEEVPVDPALEETFVDTPPPKGLVAGPLRTADHVIEALAEVPRRWRLDSILAVQDLLAELQGGRARRLWRRFGPHRPPGR